jgi:dTDP-4-amino-4,6-dideoxygalactose transaminase
MEPPGHIPFNRPHVTGRETGYIAEAVAQAHISGDGAFTARCRRRLIDLLGGHEALLVTSCTAALEMSAILAECGPGDEVIVPSYTFVTTANAFVLRGAVPVFVDIRPDTLNLDERLIEAAVTPRTKAIVPVHYAGVACAMDDILDIARGHDLVVIEDAAQAVGARLGGRALGTMGALGALSFHETKNVTCGEGGALLVNAPELVERSELLREKGTDRSRFFRGQVDKYTWVDLGSSYALSDLSAAFLFAQLEDAGRITARRGQIWSAYHQAFADLERAEIVRRPIVPDDCEHNAHMYYLLVRDLASRTAMLDGLNQRGVNAVFHYVPLHSSPAGRRFGRVSGSMRHTDDCSDRLIRLPLWPDMTDADVARVCTAVYDAVAALERVGMRS